jgi:hypothetical protein
MSNHEPIVIRYRPRDFLICNKVRIAQGVEKRGAQRYEDVNPAMFSCQVSNGIACYGDRLFTRHDILSVKYVHVTT